MTGYSNRDSVFQGSEQELSEIKSEDDNCPGLEVESKEQLLNLLQTVETDIIPRLVETHRNAQISHAGETDTQVSMSEQVEPFAYMLINKEYESVAEHIKSIRSKGVTIETLYLELFSPAARYLGYLWDEDICSFTQVTIGVGRLQELMREISSEVRYVNQGQDKDRRILLTPMLGEQHTFGMSMLIEFFYRAGWEVWGWPGVSEQNLFQLVKNEWFHIVGISMYSEVHQDELISTINKIRRASRNPSVNIMVGGYAFASNPDLISMAGADAFANDAQGALQQAEQLCNLQ